MYKKIIKELSNENAKEVLDDILGMIKETNHELYENLKTYLYIKVYNCHFSDWLLEEANSKLINEDGTTGGHWTVKQTNEVARNYGINFTKFNEYDFNYVMNMMYSDYYGAVNNDVETYSKLSLKFLTDKDAPEGKALKYYLAMKD